MAKEATVVDPLAWLKDALDGELSKVEASAEFKYSSQDRGSLTINRAGKAMQTSYFASFELQALRDGGVGALEKQKQALIDQIHRLLNPPRPQPISLTSVMPARRGRQAAKKGPAADTEAEAPQGGESGSESSGESGGESGGEIASESSNEAGGEAEEQEAPPTEE